LNSHATKDPPLPYAFVFISGVAVWLQKFAPLVGTCLLKTVILNVSSNAQPNGMPVKPERRQLPGKQ
jgi:hypothetical protein